MHLARQLIERLLRRGVVGQIENGSGKRTRCRQGPESACRAELIGGLRGRREGANLRHVDVDVVRIVGRGESQERRYLRIPRERIDAGHTAARRQHRVARAEYVRSAIRPDDLQSRGIDELGDADHVDSVTGAVGSELDLIGRARCLTEVGGRQCPDRSMAGCNSSAGMNANITQDSGAAQHATIHRHV
ncbi:MAG: hypothetical protein FD144_2560 [Rhodospirillaceae bacterium]|nr:MAG: hypothetical protein FD144_2560 [Rhodospirillaceae bacterium]